MVSSKYMSVEHPELDTDCEVIWAQVQLPGLKYLNVGCSMDLIIEMKAIYALFTFWQ